MSLGMFEKLYKSCQFEFFHWIKSLKECSKNSFSHQNLLKNWKVIIKLPYMIPHRFSVKCNTGFGNAAYVRGNITELQTPIRLKVENDEDWNITLNIDINQKVPNNQVKIEYFIASYVDPNVNFQLLAPSNFQENLSIQEQFKHQKKDVQFKLLMAGFLIIVSGLIFVFYRNQQQQNQIKQCFETEDIELFFDKRFRKKNQCHLNKTKTSYIDQLKEISLIYYVFRIYEWLCMKKGLLSNQQIVDQSEKDLKPQIHAQIQSSQDLFSSDQEIDLQLPDDQQISLRTFKEQKARP